MVLLLVLVVVALLSALLTDFAFSTLVDLRLAETFRDSTRAQFLAKGGVRVGRIILQQDNNTFDAPGSPEELWSQGLQNYPVAEGYVSIDIRDLGGSLNLNSLVSAGNPEVVQMDRFIALLKNLGIDDPPGLTDSLVDWIDSDDDARTYGAEEGYYQRLDKPYPCKNGPLDTLEELGMVRGFTPEVCRLLAPHVTVYGDAGGQKLNVNSASPEMLLAWGNGVAQGDVDRIVEGRAEAPFKSLTDLKDLIGLNAYTALNFNQDLALTSWYYRISSRAEVNEGVKRVDAVVAKNGDKLLFIKVY